MPEQRPADSSHFNPTDLDDTPQRATERDPLEGVIPLKPRPESKQHPEQVEPELLTHQSPGPAESDQGHVVATAPEAVHSVDKYRRRRRTYTAIAITAAAGVVWLMSPWDVVTTPGPANATTPHITAQAAAAASPQTVQDSDMQLLHTALDSGNDLSTVTVDGALIAAAGNSAYIARIINGVCTVYGVKGGDDLAAAIDTTGQACTVQQIATVQKSLDKMDAQLRTGRQKAADKQLADAAGTVTFYAARNFQSGQPSFDGMPTSLLSSDVTVVNNGAWLQLAVTVQDTCRQVVVAATGQVGEYGPCTVTTP